MKLPSFKTCNKVENVQVEKWIKIKMMQDLENMKNKGENPYQIVIIFFFGPCSSPILGGFLEERNYILK